MTEPEYKERKVIIVDSCDTCPYTHKCEAWKSVPRQTRVKLSLDNSVRKFILKGCPLPYGEDNTEATNLQVSTYDL